MEKVKKRQKDILKFVLFEKEEKNNKAELVSFNHIELKNLTKQNEDKKLICVGVNGLHFFNNALVYRNVFLDFSAGKSLFDCLVQVNARVDGEIENLIGKECIVKHSYKNNERHYKEKFFHVGVFERANNIVKIVNHFSMRNMKSLEKTVLEMIQYNMALVIKNYMIDLLSNTKSLTRNIEIKNIDKDIDDLAFVDFVKKYEKRASQLLNGNDKKLVSDSKLKNENNALTER